MRYLTGKGACWKADNLSLILGTYIWKEQTDAHELFCDLHTCTVVYMYTHMCTHAYSK